MPAGADDPDSPLSHRPQEYNPRGAEFSCFHPYLIHTTKLCGSAPCNYSSSVGSWASSTTLVRMFASAPLSLLLFYFLFSPPRNPRHLACHSQLIITESPSLRNLTFSSISKANKISKILTGIRILQSTSKISIFFSHLLYSALQFYNNL